MMRPVLQQVPLVGSRYRDDFPIFRQPMRGHRLTYLDSGASSQKPQVVLDAMNKLYTTAYANIHRGVYELSENATAAYEAARSKVARFINAPAPETVVFTRNATEAINLVAHSYGRSQLQGGDEIILTTLEHHSNIVPWQLLRDDKGIVIKVAPISDDGLLTVESVSSLITPRTRLIALTHIANALGTITPVAEIICLAHQHGIKVLVDGSQAAPRMTVDVQALDADFYVLTGHKMYGPSGIGVLYGKKELLQQMPPFLGGGDMIREVTFERTTYADPPSRFEAGTPAIADAIGLGAAVDYLTAIGMDAVAAHEQELLADATERLQSIEGLRILGPTAHQKSGIISFVMEGVHPHDIASILDGEGIAVRAGHHCAQPLMQRLGVAATARVSFGIYNDAVDLDRLMIGLTKVKKVFG